MIYYLTPARIAGAMSVFLQTYGRALVERIRIVTYEELLAHPAAELAPGVYIFTGLSISLGSLDPPSPLRLQIARLYEAVAASYGPACALNHPLNWLGRRPLLQTLHTEGINRFAAYPAAALPDDARFPLFLRPETGSLQTPPPLLHDRGEYAAALAKHPTTAGLLAIEFCATADADGIYRKYGAVILGERIVPRHLLCSRQWLVKMPDLAGPAQLAAELAYLDANPHADALREVARLANIGYGRIDYTVHEGRLQVWEINATPTLMHPPVAAEARQRVHERFAELFAEAVAVMESRVGQ